VKQDWVDDQFNKEIKTMSTPEDPNSVQYKAGTIPRWTVPIYWTIGFLLVHNVIPWGLSLLSNRYGWVEARPGIWNLVALIPITAGLTIIIWTLALHFVKTPERVEMERTPKYLLLQGPYRFSRNPMFLGELVLWFGWALFYGSVAVFIGFLLLWAIMNYVAVPREERDLEARFGESYLEYKNRVSRWFGKMLR
jgi:protein-S-isoprenylcysteine O-methyltransferase Ste14